MVVVARSDWASPEPNQHHKLMALQIKMAAGAAVIELAKITGITQQD